MVPYTQLFQKWKDLSDDLIEYVNPTSIVLYFQPNTLTTITPSNINGPGGSVPNIYDMLGGRMPISALPQRSNESGNNLVEIAPSSVIKSRVYWNKSRNNPEASNVNVIDRQDFCKVISYIEDQTSILNAIYAKIDGYKCKRIADPVPHGLGGRSYVTSYWEIING
jgi:hypothetical protein